MLSLRWWI